MCILYTHMCAHTQGLSRKSPATVSITRTVYMTSRNLADKESGLECTCTNNDNFTVLVRGGSRCCWVSMCTVWLSHLKWLSRAMHLHQILHEASTFIHGNYWDDSEGCSYGQLVTGTFITMYSLVHPVSCRVFLWNIKSLQWLSPPTASILHPAISVFSQYSFEREEISGHQWNSGKYDRESDGD